MKNYRPSRAEINLAHLESNLSAIMNVAGPDRFVCPMIKADAYGHGALPVARQILKNQILPLGVVLVEEALELRKAGITSEIIVFGGFDESSVPALLEAQLTPVVSQFSHLELLEKKVLSSIDVHVKFNTGMNRLGFSMDEVERVFHFFKKNPKIRLKAVLSHLHSAHLANQESSSVFQQVQKLLQVNDYFKPFGSFSHLLNSDGIVGLARAQKHQQENALTQNNWGFRPGIMMYGYCTDVTGSGLDLHPVMSLKSRVDQIQFVKKGDVVSYNRTWTAPEDSLIGVIPLGYADGVHRLLSNRGHVVVHQQMVPLVGTVCMDFVMVDLTALQKSESEMYHAEVLFFGQDSLKIYGADVVARSAETISYEMLTSVSRRVPRAYIGVRT